MPGKRLRLPHISEPGDPSPLAHPQVAGHTQRQRLTPLSSQPLERNMKVLLTQERLLTGLDHARLSSLLLKSRSAATLPPDLADTAHELLDLADVVDTTAIDGDVVTMRSAFVIERDGVGEAEVRLVYPDEADPHAGCISVLTPLGLALVGARIGQQVTWIGPDQREHGAKLLRMVYQPEAAGDHLV